MLSFNELLLIPALLKDIAFTMSIETTFSISGNLLDFSRGLVDPILMTLFQESDRVVTHEQKDDYDHREFIYASSAIIVKKRLDIMGFTLSSAQKELDRAKPGIIEELESDGDMYDEFEQGINPYNVIAVIKTVTLAEWIKVLHIIVKQGHHPKHLAECKSRTDSLLRYLFDYELNSVSLGRLPLPDKRYIFRLILESCDNDERVEYNLSALANDSSASDEEQFRKAVQNLNLAQMRNGPIVILTEGSTDKRILNQSLDLLYPDYRDYFSFLDFSISNLKGGASALVDTIKALVGCRLNNKFVAVFDNDTAAKVAVRNIVKSKLPDNIKIFFLPEISFAEAYPTIGPNGLTTLDDVNGLAGSIELYFGNEILKIDGELTPIQLKGFDESLGKYHGELLRKTELQKRFEKKIKDCMDNPSEIRNYDWSGIFAIWEGIFTIAASY